LEHAKALSVLDERNDATEFRKERILEAAEAAIAPLLQAHLESILCPAPLKTPYDAACR
jgi:hypothetical protein